MADNVQLVDPALLTGTRENPRLVFRQEDLDALEAENINSKAFSYR